MIKGYWHNRLGWYLLNQGVGFVVLLIFTYGIIFHSNELGIKQEYDLIHSPHDLLAFLAFIIILMLVVLQSLKAYLLYVPSTYVLFNSDGVVLRRFARTIKSFTWDEIEIVQLKVEGQRILKIQFIQNHKQLADIELTEFWLLSIFKKLCVNHNFLKLMAIANLNPVLMSKLDQGQMAMLYKSSEILDPHGPAFSETHVTEKG